MKIFLMAMPLLFLNYSLLFSAQESGQMPIGEMYKKAGLKCNVSYSADMVITSTNKEIPKMQNKFYFKNGDTRMEGESKGVKFINIVRKDMTSYSYSSAAKSWMKMKVKGKKGSMSKKPPKVEKLGTAKIHGITCNKYKMFDIKSKTTTFLYEHQGIIRRMEIKTGKHTQTMDYKNVKAGNLKDSLFKPPKGAKVNEMGNIRNMLPKGKGAIGNFFK